VVLDEVDDPVASPHGGQPLDRGPVGLGVELESTNG
jgi:hypothetical protein